MSLIGIIAGGGGGLKRFAYPNANLCEVNPLVAVTEMKLVSRRRRLANARRVIIRIRAPADVGSPLWRRWWFNCSRAYCAVTCACGLWFGVQFCQKTEVFSLLKLLNPPLMMTDLIHKLLFLMSQLISTKKYVWLVQSAQLDVKQKPQNYSELFAYIFLTHSSNKNSVSTRLSLVCHCRACKARNT